MVFIQPYLNIWYVFLLFSLKRLYYDRVAEGTDPLLGTIFMSIGQQAPFLREANFRFAILYVCGKLFHSSVSKRSLH